MSSKAHSQSLPSFSVILIMVALMVTGICTFPLLKIQYSPDIARESILVRFSYGGASARIVESEVTSVLEGALGTVNNLMDIQATSSQGGGFILLRFKPGTPMDMARFEVTTQIRHFYDKLPEGVSYPTLDTSFTGNQEKLLLSYTISADIPSSRLESYMVRQFIPPLSRIEGVESARCTGKNNDEWLIRFNPYLLEMAELSPNAISRAVQERSQSILVGHFKQEEQIHDVILQSDAANHSLEDLPLRNTLGRILHLGDVADVTLQEQESSSYFRINGLNTINLNIYAADGANMVRVADEAEAMVCRLCKSLPSRFEIRKVIDRSDNLREEIRKIVTQAGLALLLLLMLVFVASCSVWYLLLIFAAITADLLVACILYLLCGITLELYSMAGITVSLGIILDTAIIMTDHYTYWRDRKILPPLAGALLTTILAVSTIFLLPMSKKQHLTGFVWIFIINLSLSVVIAVLFIPALLDKMPIQRRGIVRASFRHKRLLSRFSAGYRKYIIYGQRQRWAFVVLLILSFGLPVHLMPSRIPTNNSGETIHSPAKWYNAVIGSPWYTRHRKSFEHALGGTFRPFAQHIQGAVLDSHPSAEKKRTLTLDAMMPDGVTIKQFNEVLKSMEQFLNQFNGINEYTTEITSPQNGRIHITFKDDAVYTDFPERLKQDIWLQATYLGGATWRISGLDDEVYSNYMTEAYQSYQIPIWGYNYDLLYRYALQLADTLSRKDRISNVGITNGAQGNTAHEWFITYDPEYITSSGIQLSAYSSILGELLYERSIGQIYSHGNMLPVRMVSSEKDGFDLWHITNDLIEVDGVQTRLSDFGTINKQKSGMNIVRSNHEYQLYVAFDFVGNPTLAGYIIQQAVDMMNRNVLPLGFRAETDKGAGNDLLRRQKLHADLILLIVLIVFFTCAVMFNSLSVPICIVLMIPIGMIGIFLTFGILNMPFNLGGLTSIVMMCGIVVNAAIYLVSEFQTVSQHSRQSALQRYIKAYHRKIIPTLLTILSTVLGMLPFLFNGKADEFWYSFAAGIVGSMLFSIIGLVWILPVFIPLHGAKHGSPDTSDPSFIMHKSMHCAEG